MSDGLARLQAGGHSGSLVLELVPGGFALPALGVAVDLLLVVDLGLDHAQLSLEDVGLEEAEGVLDAFALLGRAPCHGGGGRGGSREESRLAAQ